LLVGGFKNIFKKKTMKGLRGIKKSKILDLFSRFSGYIFLTLLEQLITAKSSIAILSQQKKSPLENFGCICNFVQSLTE
jgi:hypothetical protein